MSTPSYPGPGQPGGYPPAQPQSNPLAIASLVCGIVSLPALCLYVAPGLILAVVAIVLGVIARRKVQRGEAGQGGLALGGLITGIVSIVLGVLLAILAAVGISLLGDSIDEAEACMTIEDPAARDACIQDVADRALNS